jgi:hypothetical protein
MPGACGPPRYTRALVASAQEAALVFHTRVDSNHRRAPDHFEGDRAIEARVALAAAAAICVSARGP